MSAENRISPGAFTDQSILAGCPIAPALSKLALYGAHASQCTDTISVRLDDISGDAESKLPQETARIYRSSKALKALLKPEDPKIVSVVKDLGVDSCGGVCRRVQQQT